MNVFRWKNCYADVAAFKHGISVRSFFDDVVVPAIQTLEDKIVALGRSDDPGNVFAKSNAEYIYHESIEGKDPSLQAKLARERAERSWRPLSADGCA